MKNETHKRAKYFRQQKILGGALAALGILSAILLEGDITLALLTVPMGLYAVFTKEQIMYVDYFDEEEEEEEWES